MYRKQSMAASCARLTRASKRLFVPVSNLCRPLALDARIKSAHDGSF
jgi:hypothetical protein